MGGRCLGGAGFAIRVSGPFPLSSSSLPCSAAPSELQPFFRLWAGSDRCGFRPVSQGGYRACSSFARLLQPSLCDAQGHRWVAPGDRPLAPQRICGCLPLSYGDHPNRSSIPSGRGLVGVPGSPGCLPSGSGSSIFSPVPQVLCGGVGLPVPHSLFWPLDCSSGLYPCHGPCLRDHASSWLPNPLVSRRLAGPGFHLPGECSGEGFSSLALPASWDTHQSPQELFDFHADSVLSRDYDSDYSFEGFPDPQADPEVVSSSSGLSVNPASSGVHLETTVGDYVFDVSSGSRLQAPDACASGSSQCGRSSPARRLPGGVGFRLPSGSSLVVRRLSSSSRHASRLVSPRPVFVHRRVGHRLERLSRRCPPRRLVVSPLISVFHQSPRTSGGSVGSSGLPSFSSWTCGGGVLRQHHRLGVPQEAGWYSLRHAQLSGSVGPPVLRGISHSASSSVHPRQDECPRRLSESQESGHRFRMDPLCEGISSSPPLAGHHRPLCNLPQSPAACLFLSGGGPSVAGHRRHASELGRPSGLCLPSFRSPFSGTGEGPAVQRVGADVNSSILATASLVPGPSGASGGDSLLPATTEGSFQTAPLPSLSLEPPRASADCLAYLQRSAYHSGFSSAVARQLTPCRRRSTRLNYQAKWAVYRAWCHRHGHSVSRPSVSKVADFLLYLRRSLSLTLPSLRTVLCLVVSFVLFFPSSLLTLFSMTFALSA